MKYFSYKARAVLVTVNYLLEVSFNVARFLIPYQNCIKRASDAISMKKSLHAMCKFNKSLYKNRISMLFEYFILKKYLFSYI